MNVLCEHGILVAFLFILLQKNLECSGQSLGKACCLNCTFSENGIADGSGEDVPPQQISSLLQGPRRSSSWNTCDTKWSVLDRKMWRSKIPLAAGKQPWTEGIKSCTAPAEMLGDLLPLLMVIRQSNNLACSDWQLSGFEWVVSCLMTLFCLFSLVLIHKLSKSYNVLPCISLWESFSGLIAFLCLQMWPSQNFLWEVVLTELGQKKSWKGSFPSAFS